MLPKPEKRAPRPRKRIARGKGPRKVRKTTRGKMGRIADKLFGQIVRLRGVCLEAIHNDYHRCAGSIQCAHVVSRSYRSVRWSEDNAMPLCAGAHVYYTHHPLEWEGFVTMRIGDDAFAALKRRALQKWDGDIEGVCVRLAARAVALGIEP